MPPFDAPVPANAPPAADRPAAGRRLRVVLANAAVWLAICTLGAAGTYRDELRVGHATDFLRNWLGWLNIHVPLFVLSTALTLWLPRHVDRLSGARPVTRLYLALALAFFPLHMAYISAPGWLARGRGEGLLAYVLARDNFTWFLEFAWFSGTFAVVVAIQAWRLGQQRAAALERSLRENLQLQLALEQQRLQGMRQQLEPHFIFNALNSLSALVRAGEKAVALEAIERLSELLRYALKASRVDTVSIGEELAFCRGYLALQQLRHGERLQVGFEPMAEGVEDVECPPLLLQPLLENALRHDLERHEGVTRVELRVDREGERLRARVWNSLGPRGPASPGTGLGLSQARARLAMRHGGRARLEVVETATSFEVRIELPAGDGS